MELLRLEHITKNFGKGDGKVAALRDISLKILLDLLLGI